MADQVVEGLKKAKSSLKQERKPVSQVVVAQKATKQINEFVKAALAEENRWVLHPDEQTSIVETLQSINSLYQELYDKCRTPYHFEKNAAKYITMQQEISHQVSCIHLSLDQGFYLTEPRGFNPGQAIELSWKEIQKIVNGVESEGIWCRLPLKIEVAEEDKGAVTELSQKLKTDQEQLKKNPRLNSFDQPLSIKDIQAIYGYFQSVHELLEKESKALEEVLKNAKSSEESMELEQALDDLNSIEVDIQRLEKKLGTDVPEFSRKLYQASRTDAQLRMNLLRVPFEPLGMIERHLERLRQEKEENGLEDCISSFKENHELEIQQLQMFLETLSSVNQILHQVISILHNLSISFGKIYHNASSESITIDFLKRALGSIKGLVEKGLRVTGTRKESLFKIQQAMKETDLFDNPIVDGLLYTLDLIDEGREEMRTYLERLETHLELLESVSDWGAKRVYIMLQGAYEERTSLSSSAMIFDNVTQTCELFHQTLKEILGLWETIQESLEASSDAESAFAEIEKHLGTQPESFQSMINEYMLNVQELRWVLDEMLVSTTHEEQVFLSELRDEMEPVKVRLQAAKKKKEQEAKPEVKKAEPAPQKSRSAPVPKRLAQKKKPQLAGFSHDPFPQETMFKLRQQMKSMASEKAKMMYFVLTHTHMFFNMLDKLEPNYSKEDKPTEYQMEQTLMKSKTTNDFLLNLGRMKFLYGGYFNAHNVRYEYDDSKRRFDINTGSEKFLQLSRKTFDTPEGIFTRMTRILLGMEDSTVMVSALGRQVVAIMDEDFKLDRDEQLEVQDAIS